MSLDTIKSVCPAAFQPAPHQRTSESYTPIRTVDIIEKLTNSGFGVSGAQQKDTRRKEDMNFCRHVLRVRSLEAFNKPAICDSTPEVIIVNGHDGLTSYQVQLGLFRFVCANGLMVGEQFETFSISHRGDIIDEVMDATQKCWEALPRLEEWVANANKVKLTKPKQNEFAERAMQIRYKDKKPFEPTSLLEAKRDEDGGNVLWNVFNRVQENLMRGGQTGVSANGRRSTMRPIGRVTRDVEYNRKLWDLASEYAEAA